MTFWLDAHLDPTLAARQFGQIVVVTKDYDFVQLMQRRGSPPQVLWLSFGNMSTINMQIKLRQHFQDALDLLNAGDALVEIA